MNTGGMEEKQILDKLWENYELSHSAAMEQRVELESAAKAARRVTELKREISGLGTVNVGAIENAFSPPERRERVFSVFPGGCTLISMPQLRTSDPFFVMDEVEAALDEANVVRVARYMRSISDKTQFIVITHRRGTMEEADVLYGVTMQEKGVSRMLAINMNEMAEELDIQ